MKKSIVFLVGLTLALIAPTIQASIIKVAITATITDIIDQAGILGGNASVGDEITGWYAYESNVTPSIQETNFAEYKFDFAPCGIFLEAGNLKFETNTQNCNFDVSISNDSPYGGDVFYAVSKNNVTVSDMPINFISWQLNDDTMLALENTAILTGAPNLTDWSWNHLTIDGTRYVDTEKQSLTISAVVTSAVLVPEPLTLLLLTTGNILIRFRKH